ncbi:MAG: TraX family protein [Coriobacteriales bacterium]|nr:TraX family protein [Coriobacteriales bacterium]
MSSKPSPAAVLAPPPYRVLSGSALKVLALFAMLVDHTTKRILVAYPAFTRPLYTLGQTQVSWAVLFESFGRIAFPIFCFLLVEGFVYTRNRVRYGCSLACFAFLSEIAFDLSRSLTPFDPTYQNVFFTLLIGYAGLCAYEYLRDDAVLRVVVVLGLALVSMGLLCDYGPRGYAMVLMLYFLRDHALAKTALGSCITTSTWRAGLAFIPINLYNGARGFIRGPVLKYACYAFYPVHLLVLWQLRLALGL